MPYKDLLFKALAAQKLGFVAIFASQSSSRREAPQLRDSYEYVLLDTNTFEHRQPLKVLVHLLRNLEAIRPTVVIIEGWYDVWSWGAWVWALTRCVPIILWSESNEFDRPRRTIGEWVKRTFMSKVTSAHVYGKSNKEYLKALGLSEDRIFTDRAVIDTDRLLTRAASQSSCRPLCILYVGRFAPEKNLDTLCRAFGKLINQTGSTAQLMLIGSGNSATALEELVQDLGLSNQIKFEPSIPYSELAEAYSKANVFVLPSTSEPWGLVAAEAMCSGLPAIVSTRCGCAADLITAETGWVFDPASENALVEVLLEVDKTSQEKLQSMGQRARERASRYSPERAAHLVKQSVEKTLAAFP
jgi:glycosyltransferase involved in cell wall biosynthesis